MNTLTLIQNLGRIDARNITRDPALRWLIFIPVLVGLLLRLGLPWISSYLSSRWSWDIAPFKPLIASFAVGLLPPMLVGMLAAFVFLDEKDDHTLYALLVSPVSLRAYFTYRLALPVLVSIALVFVVAWTSGITFLHWSELAFVAAAGAPQAPILGLLIAITAGNKVQGFALMKAFSAVFALGLFAYFIPPPWDILFGWLPYYWAAKLYWMLEAGSQGAWIFGAVGIGLQALLIRTLLQRFESKMRRA